MRGLIACSVLLLLAACGSGGGSDGGSNPVKDAVDKAPKCSDVWQVGKTLPKDYENCLGKDGSLNLGAFYDCADGTQLTAVDGPPALMARLGGKIRTSDDAAYSAELDACKPS